MTPPDPAPILDLIDAFRRSRAVFAAVEMGVFDRLGRGPSDAASLAGGGSTEAMERLLDACVGLGLLAKEGTVYRNRSVADAYLRRGSSQSLAGYILYSSQVLYRLWTHLEDAVREGTNRWGQTFGFQGDLFSHFFKTPEAQRDFLLGMHGIGLLSSPAVVAAFDLSRFRHLVDLGGATGHLAIAARRRYPRLRATVFDLPSVIEFARSLPATEGIGFVTGDFFADELPQADLYSLGRVLHDWGEAKIRALLRKVHASLPAGGGLLIAEKLLAPDKSGPVSAHMQSLNMLVCTEGKERTLAEYAALLTEAGFTGIEGHVTGRPLDAIIALRG